MDVGVGREEQVALEELVEDAGAAPDVGLGRVVAAEEAHFGRAVAPGGAVGRVGPARLGERARHSEVAELELRAGQQDVARLDVAVHQSPGVDLGHRAEQLPHQRADFFLAEAGPGLRALVDARHEVGLHQLEDDEEARGTRADLEDPHDVLVVDFGQDRDFSQRSRGEAVFDVVEDDPLERDQSAGAQVQRLVDLAVGACPDALEGPVLAFEHVVAESRVDFFEVGFFQLVIHYSASLGLQKAAKIWTRRGLNPGPFACKANVIPLHHKPIADL